MPGRRAVSVVKVVATITGALALCLILLCGIAVAILATSNLTPLAERIGRMATNRAVRAERLRFGWDDGIVVDIDGLHLPGPAWGTAPDMIRIDHVHAVVDVDALLHQVMKFRQLRASGIVVYLERDAKGIGNWRFDGQPSKPHPEPRGGFAIIPADRTQFPTLLNADLSDCHLIWRTSSGHLLRLDAAKLHIWAPDDIQPAHILLDGSYNNVPAHMIADTASFTVMRQATTPFATKLSITTGPDRLDFDGTLMKPLDFDGVQGRLSINAPSFDNIAGVAGLDRKIKLTSSLSGQLLKTNDHWQLDQAQLRLDETKLSGQLILDEGARFHPDALAFDLTTPLLAIDPLIAGLGKSPGKPVDWRMQDFAPDGKPDATVKLRLKARQTTFRHYRLSDTALDFSLLSGDVALHSLTTHAFDGGIVLSGDLRRNSNEGRAWMKAQIDGMHLMPVLRSLGVNAPPLDGTLVLAASLQTLGRTTGTAADNLSGTALASLRDGVIDRHLTELASADLRLLFRHSDGKVSMPCLIAGLSVRNGIVAIAPLEARAATVQLIGMGKVDLPRRHLDLLVASQSESALALDLPFRISGPLKSPNVGLALGEDAWNTVQAANRELPARLQDLHAGTACQ